MSETDHRTDPSATYRWGLVIPGTDRWVVWRWYKSRKSANAVAVKLTLEHYAIARLR